MYNSKMAVAIKANGKVLREVGESVFIPFGTEYSVSIKNLNTVRALAWVTIDDVDATNGALIVQPGQTIDLERFIKDLDKGNRFKFIERTAGVEAHRGIKMEDGLVQVQFQFEKLPPAVTYNPYDELKRKHESRSDHGSPLYGPFIGQFNTTCNAGFAKSANLQNSSDVYCSTQASATVPAKMKLSSDVGITVPGSISEQKFVTGSWFPTELAKHTMILRLLGEVQGAVVKEPVTVKAKPKCVTCGKMNKATAKFCTECGTGLQLV